MNTLGAALTGIRRRPIAVAVLLVIAMAFAAAAVTSRAAVLDAEARAELTVERDRLVAEIDLVSERADAAQAASSAADECVRDETSRLQPAISATDRFSTTVISMGTAAMARVAPETDVTQPASTETILLVRDAESSSRDELVEEVHRLSDLRASAGEEAELIRLAALERHATCESAHRAVAAVVAEVGPRTDRVIAASGMAPADVVAELRAARDAVLAEEGEAVGLEALPRWLAAASEVESTHATANAAAIEAAARAAAAAAASAAQAESVSIFPPDWGTITVPFEFSLSEESIRACQPDCDPYGTGGTTPPPGWEWPEGLL
ncbi:hypothetical protein [Agromyces binzhouensis]|uniref:hypothetical protein n=1 Tax=Agromyces binzhouensis TaxID=1817495 RepID=UPI003644D3C0